MVNEKSAALAKFDKKEIRHIIEKAIELAIAGIAKGKEISKHLHKKIKKAGKLVAEGLPEEMDTLPQQEKKKTTAPKAATKKVATKKPASKKVAARKIDPKKVVAKKAVKK